MLVIIFKIFFTIIILAILKNQISLILRFLLPQKVKHIKLQVKPSKNIVLNGEDFIPIASRIEYLPFIFKKVYDVYFCKAGAYLDIEHNNNKNIYLITKIGKNFIFLTKTSGVSIKTPNYISQQIKGNIENLVKNHFIGISKVSMGEKISLQGTTEERLNLAQIWYSKFLRTELKFYAMFSSIITILGFALIIRIWFFI